MPQYLLRSALPVWALALVAVVLVAVFDPEGYLSWMPLALAGCVLLSLAIQLAISEKNGLVNRMAASLAGALVLLAVATGVFALVGA
jgi:MFS superfamily sulfate permease-like transporter